MTPASHLRTAAAIAALAAGALLLAGACSHIDKDERLIYIEPQPVARRVLIEDHTGQHCPNCPDATNIIHQLQQSYPDQIIPVAIHSERQGIMEPEGLGTELGNTYYRHWNMEFKPAGLVNRMDGGDGRVLDKTVWIYAVQYALTQPTPIDIRLAATFSADNPDLIDIEADVVCTDPDAAIDGRLQVWITEDSIRAPQDDMGTIQPHYVHNHVLRASANDTWGQPLSVSAATPRHFHYTLPRQSHWQPRHLAAVAFVYTDAEVLQATRQPILSQP